MIVGSGANKANPPATAVKGEGPRWLFRLLGAVGVLGAFCPHAQAGLNSGAEYDSLQAFYASTNGSLWTVNSNWGSGDACLWYGVACDQDNASSDNTSHVVRIFLHTNNLTGSLPALIGLSQLQLFEVDGNQLTGPIPDLAGLTSLSNFGISFNRFIGSIPTLAGTNMQFFFAGSNQLTGPIPVLGGLDLVNFDVSNNQLTGPVPDLTGLVNLRSFFADSNQLTGGIPSLDGLINLRILKVGANQLTGSVPDAPSSLLPGESGICPNLLDITQQPTRDPAWDAATGSTPWWATPFAGNQCDDLFQNGFN
jgi:hypothetical protein